MGVVEFYDLTMHYGCSVELTIVNLSIVPGRILDYNGLSGRRYLDDFDYVAFLNDGTIRAQNCPTPQKFRD